MNDWAYRDWMKFQKSFFRYAGWQQFVDDSVCFFTKELWPDGAVSKSLVLGFPRPTQDLMGSRSIDLSATSDLETITADLRRRYEGQQKFDFILVNLTSKGVSNNPSYAGDLHTNIFQSLRGLLFNSRYCCVVTEWNANSFPDPWALAVNGRTFLKLRDEKIGLNGPSEPSYYCLFFQAEDDCASPDGWHPDQTQVAAPERGGRFPTWVMPKSPPRKADEINHPAKFPEKLVTDFIEAFTVPGETVLDPMMGTGSTLVAGLASVRNAVGIDLNPRFVAVARERVGARTLSLLEKQTNADMMEGDARDVASLVGKRKIDYCVTSPPYWSMLSNEGSENQKARRDRNLPTVYSDSETDLGNIENYESFLENLIVIYDGVGKVLKRGGYLTIVVKNIKRNHTIYPLGWDLVRRLAAKGSEFEFAGNTLWCQDDVGLKPFAVGIYWVSNTLHTYCLHFRRR
jgi:DNA modification methylase